MKLKIEVITIREEGEGEAAPSRIINLVTVQQWLCLV